MNEEMLLLGLLIKQPDLIDDCQLLSNFDNPFSEQAYNNIFSDIQQLYSLTGAADHRQLMKLGQEKGVPLSKYSTLTENAGFKEQVKEYIQAIHESAIKRKLQLLGHQIINCTDDTLNSANDYMNIARGIIDNIDKSSAVDAGVTLDQAAKEVLEQAIRLSEGKSNEYIKTGILSIDRLIHGFTRKTMSIVGARPSVGKSALGLTLMSNMASAGVSCAFLSVEMSEAECLTRMVQVRSGVSMDDFAAGNITGASLSRFKDELNNLRNSKHIDIVRTTNRKISNIRSIMRKMKNKLPDLSIVFVDYVQKIQGDNGKKDLREQVGEVSAVLTDIATDLNIHVCCLAQLNRDGTDNPKVRNLKESGHLEQDAHYILLIHRDVESQAQGDYDQSAEIGIAKNRGGRTGKVQIKYNCKTTRFYDSNEGGF